MVIEGIVDTKHKDMFTFVYIFDNFIKRSKATIVRAEQLTIEPDGAFCHHTIEYKAKRATLGEEAFFVPRNTCIGKQVHLAVPHLWNGNFPLARDAILPPLGKFFPSDAPSFFFIIA